MSMIENVARAIAPDLWNGNELLACQYPIGRQRVADGREAAIQQARAAIQAMREPTEAMVAQALKDCDRNGYAVQRGMVDERDVRTAYGACIDAALSEEKG